DVAPSTGKLPEPTASRGATRPGIADTDVTGKPAAANDTDSTGRLQAAPRPAPRRSSPDIREDQDTIVRGTGLPLPKRRQPRRPPSPDDTLRSDPEASMEGDPTLLMPPRAPKAPRR